MYDTPVICKRHADEWLHRYKPTKCAACPQPLSSSAWRVCPEWLREQLGAPHGAFVHKRPCYQAALAVKNQQAADQQPMEVEQENNPPPPSFQIDVSHHDACRCGSRTLSGCSHALSVCV